jgi:signal transduction histidine kinase
MPVRALLVGIILTMAMAIFGTWNTWVTYRGFRAVSRVELRLDRLSGTIVHLDEVLTMSARMRAVTGDEQWEKRYLYFEPRLDDAIKETIAIAPDDVVRQAAQKTDVANILLVEMEHRSFDLVRDGRREEAKNLLFSPQYEEQKAIYANAITECKRSVEKRVDAQLRHHTRRALIGLGLTAVALIALGSGWASVLRLVRQGIAERLNLSNQLQDAVRARDEFLSIASHELKTPLTTLKLQVDSMGLAARGRGRWAAVPDLSRKLGVAQRQVNRLSSLIYELLDTSRITSGHMTLTLEDDVDFSHVIRESVARFKDELARASCEVHVHGTEEPILGRWDELRLDQVLSNFVSNALKYGAGKPIEIEVEADESSAQLTVSDHGIGIPYDKQGVIFSRFERAVPQHQYGGFGLGLWIVREIALAMRGQVSVSSKPGEGASFRFVVPRHAPQ